MWEELRRQLGPEFSYGPGHWFCVSHEDVYRARDRRRFPEKEGGSDRRIVLAARHGPNATLIARSASVKGPPLFHPAHLQEGDPGRYRLDQDGWINFRVPVSVSSEVLSHTTY